MEEMLLMQDEEIISSKENEVVEKNDFFSEVGFAVFPSLGAVFVISDNLIGDESGVYKLVKKQDEIWDKVKIFPHAIFVSQIFQNSDTGTERIELTYRKYGRWQTCISDRYAISDNRAIVKALSGYGIGVTTSNAKELVKYLSDILEYNDDSLRPVRSISRLGWDGNSFSPYTEDIFLDIDQNYKAIANSLQEKGDFDIWLSCISAIRKNIPVRLMIDASVSSILLEPLGLLPFAFQIWSIESGTGKTVALMASASIWGNPEVGKLLQSLNTTQNAVLRKSAFLHNIPFFGDELQTLKEQYQNSFDKFIYSLTEGVDRGRANTSGSVDVAKEWKNCFLFTGEEPITKPGSRAGSKNRVIEIEAVGKIIENGIEVSRILKSNYGFAGKMLIEYVQQSDLDELRKRHSRLAEKMIEQGISDKQAVSAAVILLADDILREVVFKGKYYPDFISIKEIIPFLKEKKSVDIGKTAYDLVLSWIAGNDYRFQRVDREKDSVECSDMRVEFWGKYKNSDRTAIFIRKDKLSEFLRNNSLDETAIIGDWQRKGFLVQTNAKNPKFTHQTTLSGLRTSMYLLDLAFGEQEGKELEERNPFK